MKQIRIAVIYCSKFGHTKLQAEAIARGVAKVPGAEAVLMTSVEAAANLQELDHVHGMIFGSPTYMGSIASEMKSFFEASVSRWTSRAWQDKIAGGFSNSSNFSGDKLNTMNSLLIFAMQMGMIWVSLNQIPGSNDPDGSKTINGPGPEAINRNSGSIGPMASSFNMRSPDTPPKGDIRTAELYGERVAAVTARFFGH